MPPAARRLLALGLSALCLLLLGSTAAHADVYWTDSASFGDNWIGRATNGGGSVMAPFIASTREVTGIASDGRHLYWSRWAGGIWRANLDGSDPEELIVTPSGAGSLATDGTYFYWSVPNEPRVSRARVDGTDVEADFVLLEDGAWPAGVATDGAYVYWTDNGFSRIGRIRTDGSGRQDQFVEDVGYPNGIAVAGGYIYWANGDSGNYGLGRVRTDGSGVNDSWLGTSTITGSVSVAGGYVYWTEPPNTRIGRVAVSGSAANANFITGLEWPTNIFATAPGFSGTPTTGALGNVVLGRRATQTFTITNDSLAFAGGQPLTFAAGAVTLTGTNANQFSIGSNGCAGQTIAPGGSCAVEVTFAPTSTGSKSASLRFTDNAPNSPQTFALSGRGTQGTASLSATTHDFGTVRTGTTSAAQSFTVTNSASGANAGPITYAPGAVTLAGADAGAFGIVSDGCSGTTLAAAARCTVEVAFAPAANGAASASLSFADDAPGSPRTVTLSGQGATPALRLTPASHDFGSLLAGTSGTAETFTLSNDGTAPAALQADAVGLSGADAGSFAVAADACSGTTLAPLDDCEVSVRFAPAAAGPLAATLSIDGDGGTLSAALSGTGVEPRRDPQPEPEPRRDPRPDPRTDPQPQPRPGDGGTQPSAPARRAARRPVLTMQIAGVDASGGGRGRAGDATLIVGADGQLRLRCAVAGATLRRCGAVVSAGSSSLGSGSARARGGSGAGARGGSGGRGASGAVTVDVRLNTRGRAALTSALGGVRVTVVVTATTGDGRRIVKRLRVTLLARRQQVVTRPGAFEPDDAALTPAGAAFLRSVARGLRGAKAVVCTGFTATRGEQGSDAAADALGLARGRAACALLKRLGVTATLTARSGGRDEPRAGNDTEAGRARNRRVELTITR